MFNRHLRKIYIRERNNLQNLHFIERTNNDRSTCYKANIIYLFDNTLIT